MVELQLPKLVVEGSNPFRRSFFVENQPPIFTDGHGFYPMAVGHRISKALFVLICENRWFILSSVEGDGEDGEVGGIDAGDA